MLFTFKWLMLERQKLPRNNKDAGLFLHLDRILWRPRCKATRNSLRRARRFEVYASEKRLATIPGAGQAIRRLLRLRKRELQNLQDPTRNTSIVVAETKVNIQVGKVTGKRLIPVVG